MLTLVIDIKCYIATFDETAWYMMYRYDPEFSAYARSVAGIECFKKLFNNVSIDRVGNQHWYLLGVTHRESINGISQPAIITKHGYTAYFKNGKLHRDYSPDEDYPAEIWRGSFDYYKDGVRHREGDYPAIISHRGDLEYYKNGALHRDNDVNGFTQPTRILKGILEYYKNGKRHRERDPDSILRPAIVRMNGICTYIENGIIIRSSIINDEYSDTIKNQLHNINMNRYR